METDAGIFAQIIRRVQDEIQIGTAHQQTARRSFDGIYENQFADNVIRNVFIEQGKDQTLWVMETEFKFKTSIMKILGPLMKKNFVTRTEKDMERFKEMVESQ